MSKFLSREWCIENRFLPYEDLHDLKDHRFKQIPVDKLGLKPIKLHTEKLTVDEAVEEFNNGAPGLVITQGG